MQSWELRIRKKAGADDGRAVILRDKPSAPFGVLLKASTTSMSENWIRLGPVVAILANLSHAWVRRFALIAFA